MRNGLMLEIPPLQDQLRIRITDEQNTLLQQARHSYPGRVAAT